MKYSKQIKGEKARRLLLSGAKKVYDMVSTTLGSRGRNIVVHKNFRTRLLHDGVKTSVEVNPKNPYENAGAEILKQAAQRQVDEVGDGTTLVTILGYSIAAEALQVVTSGINPMALKSSLEKGRDILIKEIQKLSKPVETEKEKIQVATISSEENNLGKIIGETYHKVGTDAVITAEQVTGSETFIDHQEGMQIDSGYKSEWFVTNPKSMTATVTKAKVLVTDYKLDNVQDLVPLIQDLVNKRETNLVIIAEDIEGSVLATLIGNKAKGTLNTLAIKAPSFQSEKVLQDIATVVGTKFVSSNAKTKLTELKAEDLGYASRVTSSKDATVIVDGGGSKKDLRERIESIKEQIKDENNEFNREKLKERLAKLTGGVYVVKVGGATEVEAEERYERADDSIKSTRASIEGGIVAGGEITFLNVRDKLIAESENEDYAYRILRKALEKPFNKLVENAGLNAGEQQTRVSKNKGINVNTAEVVDMFKEGIIDPTLVLTSAIKNAISVAVSLITAEGIIVEIDDEKK